MSLNDWVTLLTALTPIITVVLVFVPQIWSKAKLKAEARTETANERKVRAEATDLIVDTTMDMMTRLESQSIKANKSLDDALAENASIRATMQGRVDYFQAQLINTQGRLLACETQLEDTRKDKDRFQSQVMTLQRQFMECKGKLDTLVSIFDMSSPPSKQLDVIPDSSVQSNVKEVSLKSSYVGPEI